MVFYKGANAKPLIAARSLPCGAEQYYSDTRIPAASSPVLLADTARLPASEASNTAFKPERAAETGHGVGELGLHIVRMREGGTATT